MTVGITIINVSLMFFLTHLRNGGMDKGFKEKVIPKLGRSHILDDVKRGGQRHV